MARITTVAPKDGTCELCGYWNVHVCVLIDACVVMQVLSLSLYL